LNFLTEGIAVCFLPHFLLNQINVLKGTFLLVLFCHSQQFFVVVAHMLNECGAIANQGAFDRVNQRTGP
jgi:hypothetical protein